MISIFDEKIHYISSPELLRFYQWTRELSQLTVNYKSSSSCFGGIILGIGTSLIKLKTLFNKKINYAFTYSWMKKTFSWTMTAMSYNATKNCTKYLTSYLEKKVVIQWATISEEIMKNYQ